MSKNDNERNERFITSAKKTIPPISNNQLPADVQERIESQAENYADKYLNGRVNTLEHGISVDGYIAGATAEAERAQEKENIFNDVMQQVLNVASWSDDPYKSTLRRVVEKAQQQWKEGKEPDPVKEIQYMPVHPEDAKKPYCPRQFPMHLLDEQQAQRNHGQTLQRLKERGGLGVLESLSIVNKKPWTYYRDLKWDEALRMLNDLLTNPPK